MSELFADPLKFYADHPGTLFVTATLLPLLSFVLIVLASGAWALLRRYRDDHAWVEQALPRLRRRQGRPHRRLRRPRSIGLAFVFSVAGFVQLRLPRRRQGSGTQSATKVSELRDKLAEAKVNANQCGSGVEGRRCGQAEGHRQKTDRAQG